MKNIAMPKGEIAWVGYYGAEEELKYVLTSKPTRDLYYLYEVLENGVLKKLGKAKEPPELIEKFDVFRKIST